MFRREAEDPRAADDIEVPAVGDGGAEDAVGPVPHQLPVPRVQRKRAPVPLLGGARRSSGASGTRREVDEAVDHARRAVDRRGRLEPPDPVARAGVEGHEPAVVGPDVDLALPHGRGRVDVRAGPLRPEEPPASGPEGVERAVGVPDEDAAVRDRGRRVEVLAAAEARERAGAPAEPAGPGVERVEAAAVGAEVDPSVREGGRAVDLAVGSERPARLAGVDVDSVELVVPRAGVQRLADDER